MTTGKRVQECTLQQRKLLLVKDGNVVLSHNHTDTGSAISIIASLLLDDKVTNAFIAGIALYETLAELNQLMQESVPGWRMRITNRRRIAFLENGVQRISGRFFVDYFSIDSKVGTKGKRLPRRRFDVINLDLLREHPPKDSQEQLEMSLAILEMCDHRGVSFKSTRGGLGNSMLKASPNWVKGRQGAPRFINQIARPYLPGNFYSLSQRVRERKALEIIPHCYYVDQTSAHHNIAKTIPIPHPQHLHARGYWKTLRGKWTTPDSPIGKDIIGGKHHGLVYCHIHIGTIGPSIEHLYPPWALKRGTRYVWLWTPELRLLQDHRFQVEYFVASFTATTRDLVIPEYADFALRELDFDQQRASYKKGALLAAYGMLAFNEAGKTIYRYWGGENSRSKCEIPRAGLVSESKVSIPENLQLSTVNVIARGLIESETRTRSIEYARELHYQGMHIPQIYADGILVATDSLPFLQEGWRVSHSLTNVHIPRPNAIVSDQIVKLPGIGRDEATREWERNREESNRVLSPELRTPTEELVTI